MNQFCLNIENDWSVILIDKERSTAVTQKKNSLIFVFGNKDLHLIYFSSF